MGKKGKKKNASTGSQNKTSKHNKEVLELCRDILDVVIKDFPVLPSAQWDEYLKIYDLVERIQQKQTDECICWDGFSRDDHIEEFMTWFKSYGGMADKVQIHDFKREGYGLVAVDDIMTEEVFVTVPKKIMMTLESAKNSALGSLIDKDPILQSMPHAAIALHVLCEKLTPESEWKPYLDILPNVYSTSLYFTPDDLKSLQGTPTLGDALKPYRSIAKQYAYFYKLFQTQSPAFKHPFTFEDFRWAVSTVMTRQNQVPISDTENIKALIPMWDMCNHANGRIETGFDTRDESCKSFAIRPFVKGEQVFIFYGKRNNADLLFHNGFVYPDNEHDFVNIPLGVSKSDRLYAMKAQIMAMAGMDVSAHPYPVLRGEDPISPHLRAFLRVFSMDNDELKIRLFNPERKKITPLSELPNPDVIISERNELKSWHFFCMRLNLILSQYKTTLECYLFLLVVCGVTQFNVLAKTKHVGKHKDHHNIKAHHHFSKSSKRHDIPVALPNTNTKCTPSCLKLCTPDCNFACCVPHPHPSQPSNCAAYCPRSCYPDCSPECCGLYKPAPHPHYAPRPPPRAPFYPPPPPALRGCSTPGCPEWCFPTCSYSCCIPRPKPFYPGARTVHALPPFSRPDPRSFAGSPGLAPIERTRFPNLILQTSARLMPLQHRAFIGPNCGRFCSKRCYPSCSSSCCSDLQAPNYQAPFKMPYPVPPQPAAVMPQPICPAACPASCSPQCHPSCCSQGPPPPLPPLLQFPPPPRPLPTPAPTCPGPCVYSQACYPQCTPQCCLTQLLPPPQVMPFTGPQPPNPVVAVPPGMPQAFHPITGSPVPFQGIPSFPPFHPIVPPPNPPSSLCPAPCSSTCFPRCTTSCCSATSPNKPPEVIVLIPRPPPVCPAPCPSTCYPKCDKSCCCGNTNVNGLMPLGSFTGMCASD